MFFGDIDIFGVLVIEFLGFFVLGFEVVFDMDSWFLVWGVFVIFG